jgi:uncharacterized protein DUF4149
MLFQLVQIVYWLSLSTWFGGVLFIAMAAPVIFRTVRENSPILPTVLSVNLENQHGTLLAGTIVSELLAMLLRVEIICAGGLLISMIVQLAEHYSSNQYVNLLRGALFVAATVLALYDWLVLGPRIRKSREDFIEHADEPELANPARERFNQYHRESVTVLMILLFVLLGLILFSADMIAPFSVHFAPVTRVSNP